MLELMVRLVLGGLVVVGALLALRWAQARGMTARGGPELRLVGRTGLTRSSLVAVLAVDDRRFLVGASDTGVTLLQELDPIARTAPAPADADAAAEAPAPLDAGGDPADDHDLAGDGGPGERRRTHALQTLGVHGTDASTHGPRTGPLDRLRAMTVRTHLREPVRAHPPRR